ncbi:alkaline phosphatase D family protein [Undibacterium rugosum]|uniref:alkaline phosphatase D family protein n=1 Tax=Undibacterium rugosum TaxID=2762291 RepID=UPI001B80F8D8|nr:alkaline phosphatase D family protein [Undibacterium rugosum]MBR7777855.1 alkaline phosphatase D family protein [Undibacterium rugosum]
MPTRRLFLQRVLQLGTLAALSQAFPSHAAEQISSYPFSLGVASGSPRHDSVVLWTRLLPDPLNAVPLPPLVYKLNWEVAEDIHFKRIVRQGEIFALPELGHSVHVDVTGLSPDRWYFYRFMHGAAISPIARTRTAPDNDSLSKLRLAVASCQHWEFGEYAAHHHIAAANPDLIAFLGDYIYEWGPYDLKHPARPRRRDIESFSLSEYRARYAQYKSDPLLQMSHHCAPWIVTWDDHEVANDYANDRDERLNPQFLQRRAAAYQAFYEHMPVRLHQVTVHPSQFAHMRIYERFDWGRLARFHVLDDRQYRSYQACTPADRGGSRLVSPNACPELSLGNRTMLGQEQETWLSQGLANSNAKWNILAQQTLFSPCKHSAASQSTGDSPIWTDGWDGYPAARQRLLDSLHRHQNLNPILLSGDVHTFYAANLTRDLHQPASASNPVIATEFCGTSVTSNSRPQSQTEQIVQDNPHLVYGRSDKRGFMLSDINATSMTTQYLALDDVSKADSGIQVLKSFVVEHGKPGIVGT